jgi:hypothetical protein
MLTRFIESLFANAKSSSFTLGMLGLESLDGNDATDFCVASLPDLLSSAPSAPMIS